MSSSTRDPRWSPGPSPLDTRLDALDRDQLVALVHRLVDHAPALEELAHLPLPGEREPVEGAVIGRQVAQILGSMRFEWRAAGPARRELWPLVALGSSYVEPGDIRDARTVFLAVIHGIQAYYHRIWDEESQIAEVANDCAQGLGRCLASARDDERETLLRDLFAIYRWDRLEHGGYGMGETPERILLAQARPAERARIASWVREALPAGEREHGRWRRQDAGRFVLTLLGPTVDAAELDHLYAETSLDGPRLELLLAQGRAEEAVALVRGADAGALLGLADRLVTAGLVSEAEAAVRDHGLLLDWINSCARDWLQRRGVSLPANLDELAKEVWMFQRHPTTAGYDRLRAEARAAGRWPGVLTQLGELQGSAKKLQPLQARIRAELGDAQGALAAMDGLEGGAWRPTAIAVAAALEHSRPDEAARLYRRVIDALVTHGTKPARLQAAELHARVEALEAAAG